MKDERLFNPRHERVALVLQGGGALGAYQAGAYEALAELGYPPDWVAGVSIGAINAALIAGNPPTRRVERLREFWQLVSSGLGELPAPHAASALRAALFGVPGFFAPRMAPELSFYDTRPLRATLERLVDFDRINACETRLSLGAVHVATGNSVYFDNRAQAIGPQHVMASGALPPGFPPVEIDGALYWDGGIVSNTPLQYVLDDKPRTNKLVLQIDLFNARGSVPTDLAGVMKRHKDIMYSSRTRYNTDSALAAQRLRQALERLIARLPAEFREDADVRALRGAGSGATVDVVHLIHHPTTPEFASSDYEFSRASVDERWRAGYADVMRIGQRPDWLVYSSPELGVRVYDVHQPERSLE